MTVRTIDLSSVANRTSSPKDVVEGDRLPRRALFVTQTYPRDAHDTAGPFIREIAAGLVRSGWQVGVLAPHAEGVDDRWRDRDIEVRTFRYAPQRFELIGYSRSLERDESLRVGAALVTPAYLAAARRAVTRWCREAEFTVVHAHWIVPNGWAVSRAATRVGDHRGAVFGYGLHGSDVFLAEKPVVRHLVARMLRRCDFLTGCSPELVERVLALSAKGPPISAVIPYGVDASVFAPDVEGRSRWRRQLGIDEHDLVVLGVGRMATKKGFQVLLRELDGLFTGGTKKLHLVLAGGGDREPEFRQLASAWTDRVHFPGLVKRDLLPSLYAAADVFVLPAVHDEKGNVDGLPNVILEAMASGLPVVASRISGIPLAVEHERTGLLVDEGNGRAVVAAIHRLTQDPKLARNWGAAGRAKVESELTWDAVAARYGSVYETAWRQRRQSR